MNTRTIIIGAAWLLTMAAAYLLGRGPGAASPEEPSARGPSTLPPTKSQRAAAPSPGDSRSAPPGSRSNARGVRIATDQSPRIAVAELARLQDPVARAAGFLALAESLEADEFRDVVHDFRSLGMTSERMSEYAILLHAWGQKDPEGALHYALENTGTNFARQTVLASWAAYDPESALAFATGNAPEGKPNALLVGVIRGIAPTDLPRATSLLETLPRSEERGDALQSILPLVLKDGLDGALAWSDTIGDSVLRQGAVNFIADTIVNDDPQQAADIVLALPDQEFQTRLLDDIGESWAENDLAGAMAWAESLDPELRAEAAEGVIEELARDDTDHAAAWLDSLAATTDVDPALRSFVRTVARNDPALAAGMTANLSNDRERERSYHMVLGEWTRRDSEAARAWIQQNAAALPDSINRRFTEQNDAPRPPPAR